MLIVNDLVQNGHRKVLVSIGIHRFRSFTEAYQHPKRRSAGAGKAFADEAALSAMSWHPWNLSQLFGWWKPLISR